METGINISIKISVWLDVLFAWPVMVYRLLKYGYTYRRIYLGEGQWTILYHEDYYRLRNYRWVVHGGGHNLYAVRLKFTGPNTSMMLSMHREIMNAKDERLVDHRNCDSLDNRRSNLRFATRAENMQNRRKRKNTSSRYMGVCLCKQTGKWTSIIVYNKKSIWLGRFDSEVAAARIYDEAAKKYYGEFARLNFPEKEESRALLARIGYAMQKVKSK